MNSESTGVRRAPSRSSRSFVYGPVPSRRLGFSLGVDVLPLKTCTLDCLYCQLGPTERRTCRRQSYFPPAEVLGQIRRALRSGERIDYITFSGSGEPTLNKDLGDLIRSVKAMTSVPVAVLTNGTLLYRKSVRQDLLAADLVVPSLDAATAAMFRSVNRPHPLLTAERILEGLRKFREEYKGRLWLEIMFVKGVNDSADHLLALKKAVDVIHPDLVHINTVVRPPAYRKARALSAQELDKIRAGFGDRAEVVASFGKKGQRKGLSGLEKSVATMVRRRPVTADDISAALGRHRDEVLKALSRLVEAGKVRPVGHGRKTFYT